MSIDWLNGYYLTNLSNHKGRCAHTPRAVVGLIFLLIPLDDNGRYYSFLHPTEKQGRLFFHIVDGFWNIYFMPSLVCNLKLPFFQGPISIMLQAQVLFVGPNIFNAAGTGPICSHNLEGGGRQGRDWKRICRRPSGIVILCLPRAFLQPGISTAKSTHVMLQNGL